MRTGFVGPVLGGGIGAKNDVGADRGPGHGGHIFGGTKKVGDILPDTPLVGYNPTKAPQPHGTSLRSPRIYMGL